MNFHQDSAQRINQTYVQPQKQLQGRYEEVTNELETPIGNIEAVKIEAKPVKIESARIMPVGEKKLNKVVFSCKHPDSPDPIDISAVKHEQKGQLKVTGTWFSLDKEGNIQKGTALADFLTSRGALNITAVIGQEDIPTVTDEKGYLAFKAY